MEHLRTIDVCRFSNKHYNVAASALLDTKTRGSLRRNLAITILGQFGGEDGRISYIKTKYLDANLLLFQFILHPNMNQSSSLTEVLLHLQDFSLILSADMNCNVNVILDKSAHRSMATQLQASKDFQNILSVLSLTDLYQPHSKTSEFLQNRLYISFSCFLF